MSKRSMVYLFTRLVVALASPLVPHRRRDEWRETWNGELWHGGARKGGKAVRRSAGAVSHAWWLRRRDWSRDGLLQDARYGWRSLIKQPGFTVMALLALTLGIGANSAIFSVVNGLLLRPLDGVEQPDRLVGVWRARDRGGLDNWSYPNYQDIRAETAIFAGAVAWDATALTLREGAALERIPVQLVTRDFFELLGVPMAQGTGLDTGARSPIAVLGYRAWQRRFGGRAMVGETIELNGLSLRVAGIAGRDFLGLDRSATAEIFVPLDLEQALDLRGAPRLAERGTSWLLVVARLAPGVSLEQARAAAAITSERLRELPHNADMRLQLGPATGLNPEDAGEAGRVLAMLMAVVTLLLVIACANVANLLLARARTRTHEYGVRLALGASRARLVRQLLIESLLLSLVAAALGMVVAVWSAGLLMTLLESVYGTSFSVVLAPDWRVVGFSSAVAAASVAVFALVPAWHAAHGAASPLLATGRTTAGKRRRLLADGLVIGQVALSVVVLIIAGLFVRSLQIAGRIDAGLDVDRLVTLTPLALDETSSEASLAPGSWRARLAERVRGMAAVESVAWADSIPLGSIVTRRGILTAPNDLDTRREVRARPVSPDYFRTTGIPLRAGREFDAADTAGGPPVLIVNELLAEELWPGETALGRYLYFGDQAAEVVGVVAAARFASIAETPAPVFYLPLAQATAATTGTAPALLVRTAAGSGDPATLVAPLRDLLAGVPGNVVARQLATMEQVVAANYGAQRAFARVVGLFGVIALALAIAGAYGVTSYLVSQRANEIGIRMALGARTGTVVGGVLRRCALLGAAGVAVGGALAWLATPSIGSLIVGVAPSDPITFLLVAAALLIAVTLAGVVPARRAARVDPLNALRQE